MTRRSGLCIGLHLASGKLEVRFAASLNSTPALVGRSPEDAVRLVGVIHNLCGAAHRAVARCALGVPPPSGQDRDIAIEMLRAHLIMLTRCAMSARGTPEILPSVFAGALGSPDEKNALAAMGREIAGGMGCDIFDAAELRKPGRLFAALLATCDSIDEKLSIGAASGDGMSIDARVKEDRRFRSGDSGPLAHRMLVRIFEVLDLIALLEGRHARRRGPHFLGDGTAATDAARGRLIHRAVVTEGVITSYAIETPTSRMLVPRGYLSRLLWAVAGAPDATLETVRLALAAMDPCVPYSFGQGTTTSAREEMAYA